MAILAAILNFSIIAGLPDVYLDFFKPYITPKRKIEGNALYSKMRTDPLSAAGVQRREDIPVVIKYGAGLTMFSHLISIQL